MNSEVTPTPSKRIRFEEVDPRPAAVSPATPMGSRIAIREVMHSPVAGTPNGGAVLRGLVVVPSADEHIPPTLWASEHCGTVTIRDFGDAKLAVQQQVRFTSCDFPSDAYVAAMALVSPDPERIEIWSSWSCGHIVVVDATDGASPVMSLSCEDWYREKQRKEGALRHSVVSFLPLRSRGTDVVVMGHISDGTDIAFCAATKVPLRHFIVGPTASRCPAVRMSFDFYDALPSYAPVSWVSGFDDGSIRVFFHCALASSSMSAESEFCSRVVSGSQRCRASPVVELVSQVATTTPTRISTLLKMALCSVSDVKRYVPQAVLSIDIGTCFPATAERASSIRGAPATGSRSLHTRVVWCGLENGHIVAVPIDFRPACSAGGGTLCTRESARVRLRDVHRGYVHKVRICSYDRADEMLVSCSGDGTVHLLRTGDCAPLNRIQLAAALCVREMVYDGSVDLKNVLFLLSDGSYRRLVLKAGQQDQRLAATQPTHAAVTEPDAPCTTFDCSHLSPPSFTQLTHLGLPADYFEPDEPVDGAGELRAAPAAPVSTMVDMCVAIMLQMQRVAEDEGEERRKISADAELERGFLRDVQMFARFKPILKGGDLCRASLAGEESEARVCILDEAVHSLWRWGSEGFMAGLAVGELKGRRLAREEAMQSFALLEEYERVLLETVVADSLQTECELSRSHCAVLRKNVEHSARIRELMSQLSGSVERSQVVAELKQMNELQAALRCERDEALNNQRDLETLCIKQQQQIMTLAARCRSQVEALTNSVVSQEEAARAHIDAERAEAITHYLLKEFEYHSVATAQSRVDLHAASEAVVSHINENVRIRNALETVERQCMLEEQRSCVGDRRVKQLEMDVRGWQDSVAAKEQQIGQLDAENKEMVERLAKARERETSLLAQVEAAASLTQQSCDTIGTQQRLLKELNRRHVLVADAAGKLAAICERELVSSSEHKEFSRLRTLLCEAQLDLAAARRCDVSSLLGGDVAPAPTTATADAAGCTRHLVDAYEKVKLAIERHLDSEKNCREWVVLPRGELGDAVSGVNACLMDRVEH